MALTVGVPVTKKIEFGTTKAEVELSPKAAAEAGRAIEGAAIRIRLTMMGQERPLEATIRIWRGISTLDPIHVMPGASISISETGSEKPGIYEGKLTGYMPEGFPPHPVLGEQIIEMLKGRISTAKIRQVLVLLLTDAKRQIEIEGANRVNRPDGEQKLAKVISESPMKDQPRSLFKTLKQAQRDQASESDRLERLSNFIDNICGDVLTEKGRTILQEGEEEKD